jgi:hypothetical protein
VAGAGVVAQQSPAASRSSCACRPSARRAGTCRGARPRGRHQRPSPQVRLEAVGDLHRQPLLQLQLAYEQLDDPGELREADDPLSRQVGDVGDAVEREQVVHAQQVKRISRTTTSTVVAGAGSRPKELQLTPIESSTRRTLRLRASDQVVRQHAGTVAAPNLGEGRHSIESCHQLGTRVSRVRRTVPPAARAEVEPCVCCG